MFNLEINFSSRAELFVTPAENVLPTDLTPVFARIFHQFKNIFQFVNDCIAGSCENFRDPLTVPQSASNFKIFYQTEH